MKTIQDHYFKKAKKEGFVARSAYKLKEVDEKHKLLGKGSHVLDLGCFPGSWMQYISQRIGSDGSVTGIDRTKLRIPLKPNMKFIHSDINHIDPESPDIFNGQFDLICSDMAPDSTGIKNVDSERSFQLCQMALYIAERSLKSKGAILIKSFHGSSFDRLLKIMRTSYQSVKVIKPKSSRYESKEVFLLGIQKR